MNEKEFDKHVKIVNYAFNNGEKAMKRSLEVFRESYCSPKITEELRKREPFFPDAITHQMAMKWLREEHQTAINITGHGVDEYYSDGRVAERTGTYGYDVQVLHMRTFTGVYQENNFETYEQAVEAALDYTLRYFV